MLKTIKTTKQMRLDELVKYIFENDIKNEEFKANDQLIYPFKGGNNVTVNGDGNIYFGALEKNILRKNDIFTVEIEEPITEDTVFDTLVDVNNNDEVQAIRNASISLYIKEQTKEIHALINGRLELVWERDEE